MTEQQPPSGNSFDVVIVGAGHGGAQAAIALRQRGFRGSVALIGEEPEFPYERPPLSKEYLAGDRPFERLLFRPESFWAEREIGLLRSRRVISIDAGRHQVTTTHRDAISYGRLIWAAGGHARSLSCPGHDAAGVHSIRSRADVDRIRAELSGTARIVVVGGGYIGLEAAAVLSILGKRVTVLETLDRVLARVAGAELSRFYESEHRAHGVDVRLGVEAKCIEEKDGRVVNVRLANGETISTEMVIVGIGIVPAVQALVAAGANEDNGVLVDAYCRTSLPDIFAIGDCARHPSAFADGRPIRIESVQNASDMAATVAKAICGEREPYLSLPWFWSNQYDLKLQTVGISSEHDQTVVRGDMGRRSFSIVYLRQGRVVALDCVNAVRDYVQGRVLVLERATAGVQVLQDLRIPLKDLASRTKPDVHNRTSV